MEDYMNKVLLRLLALSLLTISSSSFALEANGTGSAIPAPVIKAWAEVYSGRTSGITIKYNGSNPADGVKRVTNKEVDFSLVDMPLSADDLKSKGLIQFPIVIGSIAPIVNLPKVYMGQLKLDAATLADIFLGNIKKWNDPALIAMNPGITLPDANIVVVHRVSPEGVRTIIGAYLALLHPQWKATKGEGMAGIWPATSIEVKTPADNIAAIKNTPYSIGYGPVSIALKNGMAYAQMKNMEGHFISPSDANVSAAAENATWDVSNGFGAVLVNQPGANTWPISSASYVLMRSRSESAEHTRELLKFFKYSLRYGGLKAVEIDFLPLPDLVIPKVRSSWSGIVDEKGGAVYKD